MGADAQGSPHFGRVLGEMKRSEVRLPGNGMNRAEPMIVVF
jgi:hypothetical protein